MTSIQTARIDKLQFIILRVSIRSCFIYDLGWHRSCKLHSYC